MITSFRYRHLESWVEEKLSTTDWMFFGGKTETDAWVFLRHRRPMATAITTVYSPFVGMRVVTGTLDEARSGALMIREGWAFTQWGSWNFYVTIGFAELSFFGQHSLVPSYFVLKLIEYQLFEKATVSIADSGSQYRGFDTLHSCFH